MLTGQEILSLENRRPTEIRSVAFSPDSSDSLSPIRMMW